MIRKLVESAFNTRCLSVASEGLIRQVLGFKGCRTGDLEALATLCEAVKAGYIQREAHDCGEIVLL